MEEAAIVTKMSKLPSLPEFMDTLLKCPNQLCYLANCRSIVSEKARPYLVRYLEISDTDNGIIIIKVEYENKEDSVELKILNLAKHVFEENIFAFIGFFHPDQLCLYLYDVVAFFFNNHLPGWWKCGITRLDLLSRDNVWINHDDDIDIVPVVETFPDLHSFGTNKMKIRLNATIRFLKIIRNFFYYGMAMEQDLELICTKSNFMERCSLFDFFTAEAVINFVKNGSFANSAVIRVKGITGLANLLQFVKSTKNFKFTNWTCSFEYRETSFQIIWAMMESIRNTNADDNGAPRAG